jgi:hypothetical protein
VTINYDITEEFQYDLSTIGDGGELNAEAYDVVINNMPFILAPTEEMPYRRESAESKRQQVDQTTEPGEQSFTGWWYRSQSSFHLGAGARFFEPSQDENLRFRFNKSQGIDVWTRGEVSLLKDVTEALASSNKTLVVGANDGSEDCLVASDGSDLTKITVTGDAATGSIYPLVTGHTGSNAFVSLTTDGTRYFAACDEAIHRGNVGGTTSDDTIYSLSSSNTVIRYVKQRLFAGIDNVLYELNPNITGAGDHTGNPLPTGHYIHPNSSWVWSDISESGGAIYAAGYAGNSSAIYKVTVDAQDATLNAATVTAELPTGEKVLALYQYLGYMMIGTTKGVRVAVVDADTADLAYGPVIIEAVEGIRGFTAKDRFVWCSGGPNGNTGLYRIDLSEQTSPLRFAYAADLEAPSTSTTLDVALLGERVAFSTLDDGIYLEKESELVPEGSLTTGFIRYATLESKFFKYIKIRGTIPLTAGIGVSSVVRGDEEIFLYTLGPNNLNSDLGIARPSAGQEFLGFKLTFTRSSADLTVGPTTTGYQIKALPGNTKQVLIQYPLYCFDTEMDRFNNVFGFDNRAYERITMLEQLENTGNTVTVRDLRVGETFQALIEQVRFFNNTAPDEDSSGFGGKILLTVRKL